MDLTNFALEAEAAQAVVLLALHGGMGENGTVQAFLQGYGVPFTGPAWDAASIAIDKVGLFPDHPNNLWWPGLPWACTSCLEFVSCSGRIAQRYCNPPLISSCLGITSKMWLLACFY